jgi:nitrogen fixation NifU-like protein
MSGELDQLYREIIMEHYRSPRGKKPLKTVEVKSEGKNPSCGDEITLEAHVQDGILKDIHVDCRGCAISIASGSMLAEIVRNKPFEEVEKIAAVVKKMLKGELDELPEDYGDLDALRGVRQFPVRVKCALLSWITLIEGLRKYMEGKGDEHIVVSTEDKEE